MPSRTSKSPTFTPATIVLAVVAVLALAGCIYEFVGDHPKRGILALVIGLACAAGAVYSYVSSNR
jgi:hypothetical protein